MKLSVDEIRQRFDAQVERFSNLETGQTATVDAPLAMALVAEAAAGTTPHARTLVDIGCGAGNYSLKLLERLPNLDVTLVDLSSPMLQRAAERVGQAAVGRVVTLQSDIREAKFSDASFDVVLAAAVLHHLRTDDQCAQRFQDDFSCAAARGIVLDFRFDRKFDPGRSIVDAAALRRIPGRTERRRLSRPCVRVYRE